MVYGRYIMKSIVRWVCQQTPTEGHRAFLSPVGVPRKTITVMDLLGLNPHKSSLIPINHH
jgi:hypothetical protein